MDYYRLYLYFYGFNLSKARRGIYKDMRKLYKEFEAERDKLNILVVQAREKALSVGTDDAIISQSWKVDKIVETLNCRKSLERPKANE